MRTLRASADSSGSNEVRLSKRHDDAVEFRTCENRFKQSCRTRVGLTSCMTSPRGFSNSASRELFWMARISSCLESAPRPSGAQQNVWRFGFVKKKANKTTHMVEWPWPHDYQHDKRWASSPTNFLRGQCNVYTKEGEHVTLECVQQQACWELNPNGWVPYHTIATGPFSVRPDWCKPGTDLPHPP